MTDKSAGLENAGLEYDGQSCRGGKCRTGIWRTKVQPVKCGTRRSILVVLTFKNHHTKLINVYDLGV